MMRLKDQYVKLEAKNRLYQLEKPIIGLTGGIATGKSSVTKILEAKGVKIIDADQLVKAIYATDEAREFIRMNFPDAWDGEIDFKVLRELVFNNFEYKKRIEAFIYARLPDAFRKQIALIKDQDFYIYDVPLLFERGLDSSVDLKILIYAPRNIQLARLIDRDSSKENTAKKILDQQIDIEDKREKADFVIDNSGTLPELAAEVEKLLLQILE
jgi:dephospho-CoA kinase